MWKEKSYEFYWSFCHYNNHCDYLGSAIEKSVLQNFLKYAHQESVRIRLLYATNEDSPINFQDKTKYNIMKRPNIPRSYLTSGCRARRGSLFVIGPWRLTTCSDLQFAAIIWNEGALIWSVFIWVHLSVILLAY